MTSCIIPGNHGVGYDSHQGAVMLFDTKHGSPIAIIDASSITAIVLLGRATGRRAGDEVTLFKSLGIAIEDLAAAHYVYRQALEPGAGVSVPFGP